MNSIKLPSSERKKLLVQLLNNNPPMKAATGTVDWESMPQDVKDKLGLNTVTGSKRNSVLVAFLRKKGMVPVTKFQPGKPTQAVVVVKPQPVMLSDEGRVAMVKSIILQYCQRGKLNWQTQIFVEHPEWRDQLGAETEQGMKKLYGFAKWLLKKDASLAHLRKPLKRIKAGPVVPAETTLPQQTCTITGPGLSIQFSASLLPTILHTIIAIALAEGSTKKARKNHE